MPTNTNDSAHALLQLLQQLSHGHTSVRCMELQFSRMQPPYHPDPEALEELVWFVLGQGVQTFSFANGDAVLVYANDIEPSQMNQFLSHLPFGSEDMIVMHSSPAAVQALITRLQV